MKNKGAGSMDAESNMKHCRACLKICAGNLWMGLPRFPAEFQKKWGVVDSLGMIFVTAMFSM